MRLIFTPMKQTNSRLQMVLLGLLMDGGQYGERPSQKLASRQPLSSLHLSPKRRLHSAVQHGPWKEKRKQIMSRIISCHAQNINTYKYIIHISYYKSCALKVHKMSLNYLILLLKQRANNKCKSTKINKSFGNLNKFRDWINTNTTGNLELNFVKRKIVSIKFPRQCSPTHESFTDVMHTWLGLHIEPGVSVHGVSSAGG